MSGHLVEIAAPAFDLPRTWATAEAPAFMWNVKEPWLAGLSKPAAERIEGGLRPDLVATDFMMPRMNGGELIDRLRRNPATARMPIILVSASPGSERKTAADAFFRKPFDPEALTARAAALLAESR